MDSSTLDRNQLFLSIIIPAYNEEKRLPQTLDTVIEFLKKKKYTWEIIIVDDGSRDNTAQIGKEREHVHSISYQPNQGKGNAVRTGMLAATGKYRLMCDSDLSTPIKELDKFLEHTSEAELLIGSRDLEESNVIIPQPWYRRIAASGFKIVVKSLAIRGIHDTQCGFKLFTEKAATRIFATQYIKRFGWDVEALFLARKYGFRIKELGVEWINDTESKVNPVKEAWRMFKEVVQIRLNDLRGKYT